MLLFYSLFLTILDIVVQSYNLLVLYELALLWWSYFNYLIVFFLLKPIYFLLNIIHLFVKLSFAWMHISCYFLFDIKRKNNWTNVKHCKLSAIAKYFKTIAWQLNNNVCIFLFCFFESKLHWLKIKSQLQKGNSLPNYSLISKVAKITSTGFFANKNK